MMRMMFLNGIWPCSHDPHLLTRFVTYHLAGDWTAYLSFEHWADAQTMSAPDAPIHLSNWLETEEDKADNTADETGIDYGGVCGGGSGDVSKLNMCNTTCAVPLPLDGSGTKFGMQFTSFFAPSKKGLLR
jgi:hypothetical protein